LSGSSWSCAPMALLKIAYILTLSVIKFSKVWFLKPVICMLCLKNLVLQLFVLEYHFPLSPTLCLTQSGSKKEPTHSGKEFPGHLQQPLPSWHVELYWTPVTILPHLSWLGRGFLLSGEL
jgi:hypothetical protein